MTKPLEYRATFETRATADDAGIADHTSTFWTVDSYGEAMAPGSFAKSLAERGDRIPLLYQHNPDINIGIPRVQQEDEKGLFLEAMIFDDGADGTTLLRRLRAGARYGLSFGFRTIADRSASEEDPLDFSLMPELRYPDVRVNVEVKFYEHSVVTFPANELAEIEAVRHTATADALRSILDDITDNRLTDAERELVGRIVAAFPGATDANSAPGPERMARRFDAEAALARLRYLSFETRNTA